MISRPNDWWNKPLCMPFIGMLVMYSALSLASQYGSSVLIPMEFIAAGLFLPLSCFTIIPLLDCARSWTQATGEKYDIKQSHIFWSLLILPLMIALAATWGASLPPSIFVGALIATNVGGFMDIMTFKFMRRFTDKTHQRMYVSNFLATYVGSVAFFLTAFTTLVVPNNVLARPDVWTVVQSGLLQATVIWIMGVGMATLIAFIKGRKRNACSSK